MTPLDKLNVVVYTGSGTGAGSVRQCLYSLRRLLSPNYAVVPVAEAALLHEPWPSTCALLVVPGGADLAYWRALDGAGNRRIADYLRRGGAYLGFCAGAYYGSARCEFERGNPPLEVVGPRELALFPGTCRGAALAGFEYGNEKGARAVTLAVAADAALGDAVPDHVVSYFNGAGVFVDAADMGHRGVEVLASYRDRLDVDGGRGQAAVVLCHVGQGKALLCGPHPEFAAVNLGPQPDVPGYDEVTRKLAAGDRGRVSFLRACLARLGLRVCAEEASTPPLSRLHLSAMDSAQVSQQLEAWEDVMDRQDGSACIRGEADSFRVTISEGSLGLEALRTSLPGTDEMGVGDDGHVDFAAVPKTIVAHSTGPPPPELTPRFDHELYYASLRRFQALDRDASRWGSVLLYGEVVSSTNSLLDKNPKLTSKLPTGFTLAASTQLAGRGRGTNAWVAPPGSLAFSVVINHAADLAASRPIIFLQYVAAIAIVEAIQSLGPGYESVPVKLKWPNDIYALDPTKPAASGHYVKIGGVLSQCGYCNGSYQVVLGIGINATNPRPMTSLSDLLPAGAAALRLETLLAGILARLESVHAHFIRQGFSAELERRYYRHWLHTGQAVRLEAEGGVAARVLGITRDWGMLRVEETDPDGRGTGRLWTLQSDENSFDFWKGLVRHKE